MKTRTIKTKPISFRICEEDEKAVKDILTEESKLSGYNITLSMLFAKLLKQHLKDKGKI